MARRLAWVIAFFAIGLRFIALTQPFIDKWSWRESDVAAIARNFFENGFHFAYPQIDWAGDAAGYVGTEFPILPFVVAFAYKFFGVQEWIGRLETVLFFAISLPFFYLLVREIFGDIIAVWSLFFYSFAPLNIVASREFMPDVPSLGLSIAGLYLFLRWWQEDRWKWLLGASLAISLALLIKLPTALVGAPVLYLIVAAPNAFEVTPKRDSSDGQRPPLQKSRILTHPKLWFFAAIALLPSAIWYWHAHRIAETFYPYHFFGGGGLQIKNFAWYWKIASRIFLSSLTPILSMLALTGLFVAPAGEYRRLFHWWLGAIIIFVFFFGWGNRHSWYQLPLVPIAAALAGCACQFIATKLKMHRPLQIAFSAVLLLSFGMQAYAAAQPFYEPSAAALRNLGLKLSTITPSDTLIIAADDGDPTVFYYAHRKGWHILENGIYEGNPLDSAQVIANLERLRARGAKYFVFYSGTFWWLGYYKEFAGHLEGRAKLIARTSEYAIYKLVSSAETQ